VSSLLGYTNEAMFSDDNVSAALLVVR